MAGIDVFSDDIMYGETRAGKARETRAMAHTHMTAHSRQEQHTFGKESVSSFQAKRISILV